MADMSAVDGLVDKLPFDQYSRQKIVSYLIDESFRKKTDENKLKIIDIGGHKGKTADFQPHDDVTILDVFDESYRNYVKGDATETTFADNTFDIACSFDVLEHIPREKRQLFINETLRISKFGVFLAVPTDVDGKVSAAEIALNNFYINLTGSDHQWLKEHIDYRIPNEDDVLKLVSSSGANMVSLSSNQIGDWQLMQMLLFASSVTPDIVGEVNDINTWYNNNTLSLDSSADIGYRKILFISKDYENVESVSQAIEKLKIGFKADDLVTVNKGTFDEFTNTLSLISKKHSDLFDRYQNLDKVNIELVNTNVKITDNFSDLSEKYSALLDKYQSTDKTNVKLIDEMSVLKERLKGDQAHIVKLTREITNIQNSKAWKTIERTKAIAKLIRKKRKQNS